MTGMLPGFNEHDGGLLPLSGGALRWWPNWLGVVESEALLARLVQEVAWEQSEIVIAGRRLRIPRLNAWYGDLGAGYGYSGTRLTRNAWLPVLEQLRDRVQEATGALFNSALLNWYRTGRDSVDWHSDDEPELGPRPTIATLSVGAARRFELRHRQRREWRRVLTLPGGSLLLMGGDTQRYWQHRVPKQSGVIDARISMTFRLAGDPAWRPESRS